MYVDNLIVGGGIAGITAALLLEQKAESYLLVEAESELGGLLRTKKSAGYFFDYGTHILSDTGIDELDKLLLDLEPDLWNEYDRLKSGSYFNCFDSNGPVISLEKNITEKKLLNQCIYELLSSLDSDGDYSDLESKLISLFGITIYKEVFYPILFNIYGKELTELDPVANQIFGLNRISCLNGSISRMLKNIPELDDRIAYHDSNALVSSNKYFYPKSGGVGNWVEDLSEKLSGVKTRCKVEGIIKEGDYFSVSFSDNSTVLVKNIIWSLPSSMLCRLLGVPAAGGKPEFLHTTLYHFVIDKKPATDIFYYHDFNPLNNIFRVTLYSNISQEKEHRLTVEILDKKESNLSSEDILSEIIKTGSLDKMTNILYSEKDYLGPSFPIITPGFVDASRQNREALEGSDNIYLIGKGRGDIFFTRDVVVDVYNQLIS